MVVAKIELCVFVKSHFLIHCCLRYTINLFGYVFIGFIPFCISKTDKCLPVNSILQHPNYPENLIKSHHHNMQLHPLQPHPLQKLDLIPHRDGEQVWIIYNLSTFPLVYWKYDFQILIRKEYNSHNTDDTLTYVVPREN